MMLEVSAPGRVNLIGEHIDYHGMAVLPMALERRVRVRFHAREDARIRAASEGYGTVEFSLDDTVPGPPGAWSNYLRAAVTAARRKWMVTCGVDASISSDLPPAAGLSSSSALLVAFTLALLRANGHQPGFEDLMEVLPEGEQFVGTRGGGMDHAASLGSRRGCASLVEFEPVSLRPIPIPEGWSFLVAHSLETAEKSGTAREAFNRCRQAGTTALETLGIASFRDAMGREDLAAKLSPGAERDAFLHVISEAARVWRAVAALERNDAATFGRLLVDSHASLRDRLRVSRPALDRLVQIAMDSGAFGARLTGAGFGGCAVILTSSDRMAGVRETLMERFYAGHLGFDESRHLMETLPGDGALNIPFGYPRGPVLS